MASGGFDRSVCVFDVRQPDSVHKYEVDGDIECVKFSKHNAPLFLASTESGTVYGYDVRKPNTTLFTLAAHDEATTCLSFNANIPTLLATASLDKTVKLWDLTDMKPVCIASKDLKIGQIYCMDFDRSSPNLLSAGGNKGKIAMWDIQYDEGVQAKYS